MNTTWIRCGGRTGGSCHYQDGDKTMAVDVAIRTQFTKPRALFRGESSLDVTLDGQRFLALVGIGDPATPSQLNVVMDWFEELRRLEAVPRSR